jgi:hypothetical protein
MEIDDTLSFLLGHWALERSIEDHRSGTLGSLTGAAAIDSEALERGSDPDAVARYEEQGEFRFGSQVTRASRSLVCHRLSAGALMFHFLDGRPFVDLDLAGGGWQSVHLCGADRYEISTSVCSRDVIQERWHVTGPEKHYAAVTTLSRLRAEG